MRCSSKVLLSRGFYRGVPKSIMFQANDSRTRCLWLYDPNADTLVNPCWSSWRGDSIVLAPSTWPPSLCGRAGTQDPYEFSTLPNKDAWEEVTSRSVHPAALEESQIRQIAVERPRRLFCSRGFFSLQSLQSTGRMDRAGILYSVRAGFMATNTM